MTIFLFLSLVTIAILIILGKNFFNSAKRSLFKDQAAWSGNELKIKHKEATKVSQSNQKDNYLERIANESKVYLEEESKKSNE
tara:strand:+ start:165 stop:413 length:249 start_codon:yes stop_codon:yes gene_type:complete